MTLLLADIDTGALVKVVVISLGGALVITAAFSACLYGTDVYLHVRREGATARAVLYAALAAVSGLVFVAAVVVGFIVMTTK